MILQVANLLSDESSNDLIEFCNPDKLGMELYSDFE